jgi:hypothetical protein
MGRHSKTKSAVIKEKIVLGTQAGKNQGVIAGELAVSRKHVNRTLAGLRDKFKDRSPEAFSAYVHRQVELLTQAIEEVWEGTLPSDAANSIRGLMDSIARLTGSNAPARTEHVNVTGDLGEMQTWQRAVYELRHVPEVLHAEFWQRAAPIIKELAKPPLLAKKELTDGTH